MWARKCGVVYLGILRKIVREDKRVSYAHLTKKVLLCFSCLSFFSPSFGSCFAFWEGPWPCFVSVKVFCQLMVNVSWSHRLSSCSVSPRTTWVSHSCLFSLGCQHHPHWLREQGFCLTAVSLVQCCLELIAKLYLLLFFFLVWKGGRFMMLHNRQ